MKTKADIFAVLGEAWSASAIYWIAAVSTVLKDIEEPIPGLYFTLFFTAVSLAVLLLFLRTDRSTGSLAAVSTVLAALILIAYIFLYIQFITPGYVLSHIVQSCMCVYPGLYLLLHKENLTRHVIIFDTTLFLFIWFSLCKSILNVNDASYFFAALVILTDIAGAVGLRMSEDGMNEGTGKAFALALCCSGLTAGVIFLLVKLFSRSGSVTGTVLSGIGFVLKKCWDSIRSFFLWLFSFISVSEEAASVETEGYNMDSMREDAIAQLPLKAEHIVIAALIAAAVIALIIVIFFRKKRTEVVIKAKKTTHAVKSSRKKGVWSKKMQEWIRMLKYKKAAFLARNTSPGVLVWLERRAGKGKVPRYKGETVRAFITRMAPDGRLNVLADDLEGCFYGNRSSSLSKNNCKELRKSYRMILKEKKKKEDL